MYGRVGLSAAEMGNAASGIGANPGTGTQVGKYCLVKVLVLTCSWFFIQCSIDSTEEGGGPGKRYRAMAQGLLFKMRGYAGAYEDRVANGSCRYSSSMVLRITRNRGMQQLASGE